MFLFGLGSTEKGIEKNGKIDEEPYF